MLLLILILLTGITTEIVGDTTPQLGGNLDINSKVITGTGGINVTGVVTATSFSGSGSALTELTGASAATYGDASNVAQIVVDANGRITAISDVTISGGDTVSITTTAADILSVSSGAISADDAGADKIVFWDDSEGKLTYLTVGTNLTVTDTTISASGGEFWSRSSNNGNDILNITRRQKHGCTKLKKSNNNQWQDCQI